MDPRVYNELFGVLRSGVRAFGAAVVPQPRVQPVSFQGGFGNNVRLVGSYSAPAAPARLNLGSVAKPCRCG